jgi:hypothetical protein
MDAKKRESLERLINQLEQAKINGDTGLTKKIQSIIQRIDNDNKAGNQVKIRDHKKSK